MHSSSSNFLEACRCLSMFCILPETLAVGVMQSSSCQLLPSYQGTVNSDREYSDPVTP